MENKKIRILIMSDDFRATSGVAHMTRQMVTGLIKTGKYQFIYLCGAAAHPGRDYRPVKFNDFGDDLVLIPVDGYGSPDVLRTIIHDNKPDLIWFMTDPRYYTWLWQVSNEFRTQCPMIYYHVWDNYPIPDYNRKYYLSNDVIATISKLTKDIVEQVASEVRHVYLPHAFDLQVFKKLSESDVKQVRSREFGDKEFVIFWNNRNARRKLPGTVLYYYSKFLEKVDRDKCCLVMHTDVRDEFAQGQDLEEIIKKFGLTNGEVKFSSTKVDPSQLTMLYNLADATVTISDAEGFGLSIGESLSCETPVVANKTGGIPDQLSDGENVFGVLIEPSAVALVGGPETPYIFEDRVSEKDFVDGLLKMYNMPKEERKQLGSLGRKHMEENFEKSQYIKAWDELFEKTLNDFGSWPNKNYERWVMMEIANEK